MSINFGAGADVHATRRLLHQQDARLDAQPFAERHFLLVAARQLACLATETSPIDFEECGQSSRQSGRQEILNLEHNFAWRSATHREHLLKATTQQALDESIDV